MTSRRQFYRVFLALVLVFCTGNLTNATGITNGLADIKVGERGKLTRIAIACDVECFVVQRGDGAFFVTDVQADLSVNLVDRANNADRLVLTSATGGSVLEIAGRGAVLHSAIVDCVSGGQKGACIDLTFEEIPPRRDIGGSTATQRVALQDVQNTAIDETDIGEEAATEEDIPFLGAVMAPALETPALEKFTPAPVLRDQTGHDLLYIGKLAPPERFSPPTVSHSTTQKTESQESVKKSIRDGSKRIQSRALVSTPRDRAEEILAVSFEINEEAEKILGKKIDTGSCAGASAKLQADAWALDAMVDRGLCLGAEGKVVEADAVFQRLLAYTPDNYEALVGRALVAADQGETQLALKYFQNALDALPPVDESRRIVSFMQRISATGFYTQ